jgi:hypothetical protein
MKETVLGGHATPRQMRRRSAFVSPRGRHGVAPINTKPSVEHKYE